MTDKTGFVDSVITGVASLPIGKQLAVERYEYDPAMFGNAVVHQGPRDLLFGWNPSHLLTRLEEEANREWAGWLIESLHLIGRKDDIADLHGHERGFPNSEQPRPTTRHPASLP